MQEQNIMDFNQIPKDKREAFEGEQENDQDWEDNDGADVNVDFQFYDPSPDHFHAVKNLVNTYLDGASFKSSELTELIVSQVQLGTMVGIEDAETEQESKRRIALNN